MTATATATATAWPRRARGAALLAGLGILAAAPAAGARSPNAYTRVDLVSDQPGHARITDPNLVNAWGLAAGPSTPIWVADNGTDVATLYSGGVAGNAPKIMPLVVKIPGGAPTGQVFNGSSAFGGARFILSSEAGRITAWTEGTSATTEVTRRGAIYKGLAIAGRRLYATDFHNGRVDVFGSDFSRVRHPGFRDRKIPRHYAPFGIQRIGNRILVSYAKQDAKREDDVGGAGRGFVDVYSRRGHLVRRLIKRGRLDSPWGLVRAPRSFGAFGGSLLVGNFGDGAINAYSLKTGAFRGRLRSPAGHPITIPGLWGLQFGNSAFGGKRGLVFSAGPADEEHGLLGVISASG
jgi:uncharacterized protein (TIGR03118 family)